MDGKSDLAQMSYASAIGYVIYSSNMRDFARLHAELLGRGGSHPGMIMQTRRQYSLGEQARRLLHIWNTLSAEEMVNRSESLSSWPPPER